MATPEQQRKTHIIDRSLANIYPDYINKLPLKADISLNNFVFNTIDEYGVLWVVVDVQGWWGQPGIDIPEVRRSFGDGSYEVSGRYVARSIDLEGSFLVPDPSMVEAARDRLISATNLVYEGAWLKMGINPTKASFVRINGDVKMATVNPRGRTNFSIGLMAADPVKYSWNEVEPDGYNIAEMAIKDVNFPGTGEFTLENVGNYKTQGVLEIVGPLASPGNLRNKTTDQLIIVTKPLKGPSSKTIVNKQSLFNINELEDEATLTTGQVHDFSVGEKIQIDGVGFPYDGEVEVTSTPTDTTFTFVLERSQIVDVSTKALQNNVATIETLGSHPFSVGNTVIVKDVDGLFDGTRVITQTPNARSFRYALQRPGSVSVISALLISNIATLTTNSPHLFIVGETVTVSGVGLNYDGSYEIINIISPTQFSYVKTRTNGKPISNRSMANDIVTITTSEPHGFIARESVNVIGTGNFSLDGGYQIQNVTSNTFTYRRPRTTERRIVTKSVSANVVTLTTSIPHGYAAEETVIVDIENDATLSGTYQITAIPGPSSFRYTRTGASNLTATNVPANTGRSRIRIRKVKALELRETVAIIETFDPHGVVLGESITLSGFGSGTVGSAFTGTFTVSGIPSLTTVNFDRPGFANITAQNAAATARVTMLGTVPALTGAAFPLSPPGRAFVGGALPLSTVSGTASAPANITRRTALGKVIKPNEDPISAAPSGSTAIRAADSLKIDTKNREVSFNDTISGARDRIDVLADFIEFAPGENELEFEDLGNPSSQATLKIYYRSGWIG